MARSLIFIFLLLYPAALLAEDASPPENATAPDGESPNPEPAITDGLPGPSVFVAYVHGSAGLTAGEQIPSEGRTIELPDDGCIRLLAGESAGLAICGAARFRIEARQERFVVSIESGRGLFTSASSGSITVSNRRLALESGIVYFDTSASPVALLISGEGATFDGQAVEVAQEEGPARELRSPWWCAPPRPTLAVSLGDPSDIIEQSERARNQRDEGSSEDNTAEGGATCVDSADSASASDPNSTDGGQIDPDVRRDQSGRLRLIVRIPRRN